MDLKCTILIKDEVNCTVIGLDDKHSDALVKKYAMLVPNRFHMAKFKLGVWDGTISFFKSGGDTYVNLLDEIVPMLYDFGYDIKLKDRRRNVIKTPDLIDNTYLSHVQLKTGPLILHDHQVRVINDLITNGGGMGKAATGAGKTFITGAMTLIYEKLDDLRVMTIVPNKTLVKQTYKDYILLGIDTGIFYGDQKNTDPEHVVTTWQSLKNNPRMVNDYDVIIVDEAHGIKGPVLQDLLLKHGKNIGYRFGVTGTLPDEEIDCMSVRIAIGDVVTEVEAHELIDLELLSALDIEVVELEHNFKKQYEQYKNTFIKTLTRKEPATYKEFKEGYLPDWQSEKSYNSSYEPHMSYIASQLEEARNKYGNVLCLVDGVKHGEKMAEMIDGAYFLSGKDSTNDRDAIYEQYDSRDDIILFATAQIASTGLNIKRIFTLAYINFGKSGVKVIQSIGRGLRVDFDKNRVKVLDFTNDLKYAKRHTNARIKYYKTAKYPYKKRKVSFSELDSNIFD